MHNGDGIAFDFRFVANAGSPRDLDFSVPDLRLLHDHIQDQNSDAANYLASDLPAAAVPLLKPQANTNTSPKRKRAGGGHGIRPAPSTPEAALNCANLFPPPFLPQLDSSISADIAGCGSFSEVPTSASTPTGARAKATVPATTSVTPTNDAAKSTGGHGKPANGSETTEEKQERIRRRNREHARKCRIRKRQAADNLAARVKHLEQEYSKLLRAFRQVYNSKALMDSLVVSEFGEKGSAIVEKTNKLALISDKADILTASASVL